VATPQQTPDVTPAPAEPAQPAAPESQTPSAQSAPNTPAPSAQPEAQAAGNAAIATPTSAADVCAVRTTSVHFGARGSALSRENRNAIEYATDAASVCNLQSITIADSGSGRLAARRDAQIRQALVRQGVSADKITTEPLSNSEAASTGRVDVRMIFAGTAGSGTPVASNNATATPPANEPGAPAPDSGAQSQPTPPGAG
jgi:hypothetical protein